MDELKQVEELLPTNASVADTRYEASDIVVYTDSKEFFLDHSDAVRKIVSRMKKRVEVRPSSKLFTKPESAKEKLEEVIPDEAGFDDAIFQPSLGKVIIRAEKPGKVIGNNGSGLDEIKKKTLWAPQVERVPAISSKIVDRARELTVEDPEFRKDFLHEVGEKIRRGEAPDDEWVRVGGLGGFRQVGRSSILLQTEESTVLMDAGINPSADPGTKDNFPILNAPELDLQDLDAVVLSHAHMDHCLTPDTPVTMADGSRKKIGEVEEGDRLKTLNWSTCKVEEGECTGTKQVKDETYLDIETAYNNIEASGDHKFFRVSSLEIEEVEASELEEGDMIPRKSVERDNKPVWLEDGEECGYPKRLNRELARFIGYFYGDGHRTGNRLRLTDKNIECLENYKSLVTDIFGYRGNIREHPDRSKNAYSLEINNVRIIRYLENNFDNLYEKAVDSRIPEKIRLGSEEAVKGFIEGFFDAEGDVGNQARMAQSNAETRRQLQNLLSSIDIKATNSNADKRVCISSKAEIKRFIKETETLHPKKTERLEKLYDLVKDAERENKIPVTSKDLHRILDEAGMKGRVNGSPSYKELETCLVDWYRRDESSYATESTVRTLVQTLEERKKTLQKLDVSDISESRKAISLTRSSVVNSTSSSLSKVQLVEDKGRGIEFREEIESCLEKEIQSCISRTEENIEKLEHLLNADVEWHEIRSINKKDNEYGYLVDIKVDPNHNFIANDQVVHNCGMIPYLYKMGYDGPLYCTKPTRDMMIMLALDYIGIAHQENQDAPYDSSAIKKAVKRTITPDYGEVTDITSDMKLTLRNSGHILGSSLCHVHVGEGIHNVLYTGDYNYDQSEMLRPADTNFKRVETMITESTYGGKDDRQQPREEAQKKFLSKMKQTLNKGGKVIVPVFAIGRSQEILGMLADELDRDYFDYNVFIDGMINDANALHTAYPEFLSKKVQKKIFQQENNPFTHDQVKAIGSHSEREDVIEGEPSIILATSGMLTGGPVLSYLEALADDPKNAMIFVGYQASGTLGNKIQQGRSTVNIGNSRVDINLDVNTVSGFSAHSDRQQIINFCKNLRSSPNRVLTNHGEESKCFSLASTLHKVLHIDTSAPQNLDVNRLN